jgi:hypothetical protein
MLAIKIAGYTPWLENCPKNISKRAVLGYLGYLGPSCPASLNLQLNHGVFERTGRPPTGGSADGWS